MTPRPVGEEPESTPGRVFEPAAIEPDGEVRLGSGAMFDAIAVRYDRVNRVLSMGLDRRWRRLTVEALAPAQPRRVLDVATGTGDLAIAVARRFPQSEVTGLDPSQGMIAVGLDKLGPLAPRVHLEVGDAQAMPYEDASFDAACMAFGIRNVPDRPRALRELRRVLRSGGRVAILELNEPRRGWLAGLARLWIRRAVPRIGAWLSGDREYRYLQESIAAFPPPESFVAMMGEAGLVDVRVRPLTFGVCCLYVGVVP